MRVLVTGAAGFIGFHLSARLLRDGHEVVGVDSLNSYYSPALKQARLAILSSHQSFTFKQLDLAYQSAVDTVFEEYRYDCVVHLAAQAGVRYSIDNPRAYIESNIDGFFNVLEACRNHKVKHFLYASSSSVYGNSAVSPLSTEQNVDRPISLYAATKKSNELMAHTYSHLYQMRTTGLRFFTVYGPWGRPDMAYFKFAEAITQGRSIDVYNHGDLYRDFTYIDDIVEGVVRLIAQAEPSAEQRYAVYNIGNHTPVKLLDFIAILEAELGLVAVKNFVDMQPGDVYSTCADVGPLRDAIGFEPITGLQQGLASFVDWYKNVWLSL